MADVFISYSRDDRETARTVASALEAEGLSVWWDAALRAGEAYDEVTEANLRGAGAVVVLWSKRSTSSKWVRAEATVGERSSTLVPILIEECERPIRFELVQTADLRHWRGDRADPAWRAFMQDIRTALSKRSGARAAAPAAAASTDSSVETTFWNSIKDGRERADFEAYLQRYPNGHFASLAQNRLATLARGGAQTAPARPQAQPAAQQRPQQQAARPAAAQGRPQAQAARTSEPAAAKSAPSNSGPAKKSGGGLLIAGVLAALIIGGGVAAFVMTGGGGGSGASPTVAAATPAPVDESAAVDDAAAPPEEPAVDVLGDMSGAEEGDGSSPSTTASLETEQAAPAGEGGVGDLVVEETPQSTVTEAASAPATPERPAPPASAVTFTDCPSCPLMARLPGGTFTMGSPSDEPSRNAYEGPQREVTVKPFAIGVYEVTSAEWKACVDAGGCAAKRADETGKLPALGLSWRDASAYVAWLSSKTGRKYRLPTEAEWEYAARAGSSAAYWWGDRFDSARVSRNGAGPVGSFPANAFGLFDVTGNAREWVADCYVNNFVKAPTDGSAVTDGDCGKRVVRGGYWGSPAADMRVANRSRIDSGVAASYMGVRVAASPD